MAQNRFIPFQFPFHWMKQQFFLFFSFLFFFFFKFNSFHLFLDLIQFLNPKKQTNFCLLFCLFQIENQMKQLLSDNIEERFALLKSLTNVDISLESFQEDSWTSTLYVFFSALFTHNEPFMKRWEFLALLEHVFSQKENFEKSDSSSSQQIAFQQVISDLPCNESSNASQEEEKNEEFKKSEPTTIQTMPIETGKVTTVSLPPENTPSIMHASSRLKDETISFARSRSIFISFVMSLISSVNDFLHLTRVVPEGCFLSLSFLTHKQLF